MYVFVFLYLMKPWEILYYLKITFNFSFFIRVRQLCVFRSSSSCWTPVGLLILTSTRLLLSLCRDGCHIEIFAKCYSRAIIVLFRQCRMDLPFQAEERIQYSLLCTKKWFQHIWWLYRAGKDNLSSNRRGKVAALWSVWLQQPFLRIMLAILEQHASVSVRTLVNLMSNVQLSAFGHCEREGAV